MSQLDTIMQKFLSLPDRLSALIMGLSDKQLQFRTSEDSWSIAQLINHIADAQTMAYYRMKLVYSEDNPVIQPYSQNIWAGYPDSSVDQVNNSLNMIKGVYPRWVALLQSLQEDDWQRQGNHLEAGQLMMSQFLDTYFNHGENHLKQITELIAQLT